MIIPWAYLQRCHKQTIYLDRLHRYTNTAAWYHLKICAAAGDRGIPPPPQKLLHGVRSQTVFFLKLQFTNAFTRPRICTLHRLQTNLGFLWVSQKIDQKAVFLNG